jgi:cytochrome P450
MDMHGSLPFSKAFDYASGETTNRFTNPLWKVKEFFFGKALREAVVEVHRFSHEVVAEAVRRHSEEKAEQLNMKNEKSSVNGTTRDSADEKKPSGLESNLIDSLLENLPNPDLVADAAMNFLSAGRDTTAQSLTWTFYTLMRNPTTIPLIRAELSSLLSPQTSNPPSSSPSPASTQFTSSSLTPIPLDFLTTSPTTLPYTHALFSETLRLYPPVPYELKEATAPTTFPDGTYLPASSVVLWVPWAMGRNTLIWGSDALAFKPERWLDPPRLPPYLEEEKPTVRGKSAYENPVFNAGPRSCLGKKMAEVLGVYVVGKLVWEYDFEECLERGLLEKGSGVRMTQNSLTLPMEGGLPVRVRRRV